MRTFLVLHNTEPERIDRYGLQAADEVISLRAEFRHASLDPEWRECRDVDLAEGVADCGNLRRLPLAAQAEHNLALAAAQAAGYDPDADELVIYTTEERHAYGPSDEPLTI
jgi:hypothetical protein